MYRPPLQPSSFLQDAITRERRLERAHAARRAAAEAAGEPGVYPEPDERPTHRAQWDEINGRWVEWDEAAERWIVVRDVHGGPQRSGGATTSDAPVEADAAGGTEPGAAADPWMPGAPDDHSLDDIE